MKLNVFTTTNVFGHSGYAEHTKSLSLALDKYFSHMSLEIPKAIPDWKLKLHKNLVRMIERDYRYETNLMITYPNSWYSKMGLNKNLFGYAVWEGDKAPYAFVKPCLEPEITRVFCPSKHTRDSFINGGVPKHKIDVIPHGVDTKIFNPDVKPHHNFEKDRFTFFFNGGWAHGKNDRKGADLVMKAFCEEFSVDEPLKLVMKINTSYTTPNKLKKMINDLDLPSKRERPPIQVLMKNVSKQELAQMYKSSDCHVITSKAEGFCLPLLESMAVGKPVITSEWGGQREFCNRRNSYIVKMGPLVAATDPLPLYRETRWKVPRIDSIRKQMRRAYEDKKTYKKKSKNALKTAKKFTWDSTAKQVAKIIKKYE
ncbi:MAG: glycosyltransferase family 4 protein [Candidatus Aenigmatarchaeota archaeon]